MSRLKFANDNAEFRNGQVNNGDVVGTFVGCPVGRRNPRLHESSRSVGQPLGS